MGITNRECRAILEAKKEGILKGKKILQLGRQCVFLTLEQVQSIAKDVGCILSPLKDSQIRLTENKELRKYNCIDDTTFFALLGFEEVHSLDVTHLENATFVHDLNLPIPQTLYHQYDVVYDGGTMEHVFSTKQVLENIHKLLKIGGIVIHGNPSHNCVDHGFYVFSPILYRDYYTANAYRIVCSQVCQVPASEKEHWKIYPYQSGSLANHTFGGLDHPILLTWFIAQKQPQSTGNIIPQQGMSCETNVTQIKMPKVIHVFPLLREVIKKFPYLHAWAKKCKKFFTA